VSSPPLLDIEGRPAIDLALQGSGPLDDVDLDFALDAAGDRLAEGTSSLREHRGGPRLPRRLLGRARAARAGRLPPFFAGADRRARRRRQQAGGGLRLDELAVSGAALELTARSRPAPTASSAT
jgi:translocation and assembly module TamB